MHVNRSDILRNHYRRSVNTNVPDFSTIVKKCEYIQQFFLPQPQAIEHKRTGNFDKKLLINRNSVKRFLQAHKSLTEN